IFWSINASSPKRRGTRINVFFLNERTVSFWMISAINNLTALEPISMAAYLTVLSFIFQIIICIQLGAMLNLASATYIAIVMSLVDLARLGIILQLNIDDIPYFALYISVIHWESNLDPAVDISRHQIRGSQENELVSPISKNPDTCVF